jgi:hypothetical protein
LGIEFQNSFVEKKWKKENGGEFSTDEDDWIYPFFDKLDNKN